MRTEPLVEAISAQPWLDTLANALQPAVDALFPGEAGQSAKDLLHGTWLGHPLHPVLTDVPIGAWTAALALDALQSMTGRRELAAGADAAIGVGLLGAVGAAVTGMADWSETDGAARKVGALHATLNIVATTLFTASWVLRKQKKRESGVAVSMLGYAIASASAYLGGHLVFNEQIGVDHTATADMGKPEEFVAVCDAASLPEGRPVRANANGVAVVLVRRGASIDALAATCPHLGGPLDEGKLEGDTLTCPWHGSSFCVEDGSVRRGPSVYPAPVFETRVREGRVEVRAKTPDR